MVDLFLPVAPTVPTLDLPAGVLEFHDGREPWLMRRKDGIGATDAAAILGYSPFSSAYQVWLDKKGFAPNKPETEAMRMGLMLEPIIAQRYADDTGRELADLPPYTMAWSTRLPIAFCSPDRLALDAAIGVELKAPGFMQRSEFGDPWTDQIPMHYLIQCHWSMACTGLPEWHLAALIGGQEYRPYKIMADPGLNEAMFQRVAAWWERFIVGNEEPPVDGEKRTGDALGARFPRSSEVLSHAPESVVIDAARLLAVKAAIAPLEAEETLLTNQLKAAIADGLGFEGGFGKVTWKSSKDTVSLDKDLYILALEREAANHGVDLPSLRAASTTTKPGSRRFLVTASKEKS